MSLSNPLIIALVAYDWKVTTEIDTHWNCYF